MIDTLLFAVAFAGGVVLGFAMGLIFATRSLNAKRRP